MLRLICATAPTTTQVRGIATEIDEMLAIPDTIADGVAGEGWFLWTAESPRQAFLQGLEIERRLLSAIPRIESIIARRAKIRWGIWLDQYVLPFDDQGGLAIGDVSARAIFNFEPDDMLFSSEPIYLTNRKWEHFACIRRRLLDGQEDSGYRMLGRKRPSARDHADAGDPTPFVGRENQISLVEYTWKLTDQVTKLVILAPAGSGKTRLVKEWIRRHPELRALIANFSLFGGGVEDLVSQLAELPSHRFDHDALVETVVARIRRDDIEVLVLDDLHWAGPVGQVFIELLLPALWANRLLVVLASRPSGRAAIERLQPDINLELAPLASQAIEEMARGLIKDTKVAAVAVKRAKGNPLFVEQFAAWAGEVGFHGGRDGPRNLHQVIAARVEHLSLVRLVDIQRRLRWGRSWERQGVIDELGKLEVEIGLWLDRLETGDYTGRVEAARHLVHLERLDYEIFITGALVGRPRARSSRLQEAIERLLIGSAEQILADLKRRAGGNTDAAMANVAWEAQRAGDVLLAECNWRAAREFYELVHAGDTAWQAQEIVFRLAQCHLHTQESIVDDREVYSMSATHSIEEQPNVGRLELPYVWAGLGHANSQANYFVRAAQAAEAINDPALADWAKGKAAELYGSDTDRRLTRPGTHHIFRQ